jgi:hypothetical protein
VVEKKTEIFFFRYDENHMGNRFQFHFIFFSACAFFAVNGANAGVTSCPPSQAMVMINGSTACVCPNINESLESGTGNCVSAITANAALVLANYFPAIFDTQDARSLIMNRSNEPIDTNGKVTGTVDYPPGNSYTRKIWICAPPATLNTNSGSCSTVIDTSLHACDAGNAPVSEPASAVSSLVSASNDVNRFTAVANKKLACCLNDFGSSFASIKYDCVENAKSYADFNQLWESFDSSADGNQIPALVLSNQVGSIISGFYTLQGQHCDEFSEFAGDIQPGILSATPTANSSFKPLGSIIPNPGTGVLGYSEIRQKVLAAKKSIPTTDADKRRCPILVRAAIIVSCPPLSTLPFISKTYELRDSNGNLLSRRCSSASSITTHIRMEQVYQITNQSILPLVDTISISGAPASISVDRILLNKYGNTCPPGTTRSNGICTF